MEISLSKLLDKYKNIVPTERIIREAVEKAIKETINIELERKDISYTKGVVYVNTSTLVKNKVYLNKEKILYNLRENLGKKAPKDIR